MRFDGRTTIVTGAAQGMGRAISKAFIDEGATVLLADLNTERVEQTAKELDAGRGVASAVACDVTKADQVASMIQTGIDRYGKVDHFVNNAGTITMHPVVELTEEDWDLNMTVNAKGVFLCMRAVLPHMLERKSGTIVNVASQAGKRGYRLFAHYCASKAAVILLSKGTALEVAPHVRINCVCPGIVNTDMMEREYAWEEAMTGEPKESIQKRWMAGIPMQRFQEPEDVAKLVLFLASDDSSEMTGQAVNITGGMVME
ncbi:MAG TPA: SDR family NAD(P)-dependent oxidoreductase [Gaiellales bacterium]|jgi:NAD(P)-dependent dehydrogenase (short-subunit alcohol dehydrogenase family)|nr:SDR family NAD(P)-dependent oxidoreductase [Gaiellales bacterium]